jgi:hypothetical protein
MLKVLFVSAVGICVAVLVALGGAAAMATEHGRVAVAVLAVMLAVATAVQSVHTFGSSGSRPN